VKIPESILYDQQEVAWRIGLRCITNNKILKER
jgi:hypothetical protein